MDQFLEEGDAFPENQIYHHDQPAVEFRLVVANQSLAVVPVGMLCVEERRLGWEAEGLLLRIQLLPIRRVANVAGLSFRMTFAAPRASFAREILTSQEPLA